ncbi:hypothetical protein HS088_TW14G00330 [Tripterygium wilfordii]|uniref:Uncharacterized protein n=1 Tax=Tripterygium wilfordii TaxID=458696 RepID=A0A7J7CQ55_TRIWF|nr:hypothetical protein HS088_TW14G00330 [Tripterygium wilfordii]
MKHNSYLGREKRERREGRRGPRGGAEGLRRRRDDRTGVARDVEISVLERDPQRHAISVFSISLSDSADWRELWSHGQQGLSTNCSLPNPPKTAPY